MRSGISLLFTCILHLSLTAQQQSAYILNGTASQETCDCYQLTGDLDWQGGAIWNKNEIDLSQSFNYVFNIYLGCKTDSGADGIVFVLQANGTGLGAPGEGLAFKNISPSIGITIDTWQNLDLNDPSYDHIGIYKNGDLVNGSTDNLAGPVEVLNNYGDIEDCTWHTMRVIWDAGTKILSAEIDGVSRIQTHIDLVNDIFNNNSQVYWGFTGATGGHSNFQKVCTSLIPYFSMPAAANTCAPATITFTDNSISFGSIVNWWWDFGDGTQFNGENPQPHVYPRAGYYTVKLNIEGNDGCISDTFKQKITVSSIPEAGFKTSPPVICANSQTTFIDESHVDFGTIDQWTWNFDNSGSQIETSDSDFIKSLPEGIHNIQLAVRTAEGCVSPVFTKTMNVTPKPSTSISVQDACYGDPVPMIARNLTPDIPIEQWYWLSGDGTEDSTSNVYHYYAKGGVYTVGVFALNNAGCSSDTVTAVATVYQTNAKIGNDTVVAFGQPLQLKATGGELYEWMPSTGLNNPYIADPIAILSNDMQYIVKASTSFGCPTYDTILIKAYKGPNIYVPNAFTPDNNGLNDRFHPVAVGMSSISYFEIYNRLGQRVYSNPDLSRGWDGTLNGKTQPTGTYVWIIKGQDYQGRIHSESGTVVLIR